MRHAHHLRPPFFLPFLDDPPPAFLAVAGALDAAAAVFIGVGAEAAVSAAGSAAATALVAAEGAAGVPPVTAPITLPSTRSYQGCDAGPVPVVAGS